MSEMIDRVAAALTAIEFTMPGAGGLRGRLHLAPAQARDMAHAAIEAMREPTDDMLMASGDAYWNLRATDQTMQPGGWIWYAMINQAGK